MSFHINVVTFSCLAVYLLVSTMVALRWWRIAAAEQRRADDLERRCRADARELRRAEGLERNLESRDREMQHLAQARLPAAVEAARSRSVTVPGPLDERVVDSQFGRDLEAVAAAFPGFMEAAQSRADQAARTSLASAMKSLQGLANEQQLAISAMQERHDDPQLLQGLLEIDHMNAQIGRRAQAIAVLCGAWPGRQRASSPVVAVVRGATSRIRDYQRVNIRGAADLAVVSRAVEPTVLAVAELLDNAARHSRPDSPIEVFIQSFHNGVSIVIDDCGVGMLEGEMRQAAALLSGARNVEVTALGDPPAFGHAVVGRLAARYGFQVFADSTSPFGGLRVVVFLPGSLLTTTENPSPFPVVRRAPIPPTAPADLTTPTPTAQMPSPDELPQRRRQRAVTQPAPTPAAPQNERADRQRPGHENSTALGAFQRGTRAGRWAQPSAPQSHRTSGSEATSESEWKSQP